MTVVFAPGQGAQKSGMLTPWCNSQESLSLLAEWSKLIDVDLQYLGTQATTEEITDTAIAQPLLVAAGILSFYALSASVKFPQSTVFAGHSIGELTVAAITGIISDHDAIRLAAERGRLMARACQETPSTMAAVLGGDKDTVLQHLKMLDLVPANFNAEGQIVAAGACEKIDELIANPPQGARVRKLVVAGAFHSPFMSSARQEFADITTAVDASNPLYVTLSNRDGQAVSSGEEFLDKIVQQITSPVQWTACLEYIRSHKVDGPVIELAPAGVLLGIAKRELKDLPRIAINTPEDIDSNSTEIPVDNG